MKTLITSEVIENKNYLINTYCKGFDAISLYNKSSLEKDIKILEAYGKVTYELDDNEENLHLYSKPQFAQIAKDVLWVITNI